MSRARHRVFITGRLLLLGGAIWAHGCTHKNAGVGGVKTGERCDTASACVNGAVCLEGICRQVCSNPAQCPTGDGCVGGICGDCGKDDDCAGVAACRAGSCALSCAVDSDCKSTGYCTLGLCVEKFGPGATCTLPAECAGDFCVAGLCCEDACGNGCESCDTAFTGAPSGSCRPILVGTDPASACPGQLACDGAGACFAKATGEPCALTYECAVGACDTAAGACCLATCTRSGPSSLATSLLGPYDVLVTWQDNSDTETGYLVERCAGAACAGAGAVYTTVATLPPDTVEFRDLGRESETVYFYRVSLEYGASLVGGGLSGIATAPAAPAQVQVLEVDRAPRVLVVRWLDVSLSETEYRVSYVRVCPTCGGDTPVSLLVAANTTSAELNVLSPGTAYEIRVEAMKGSLASAPASVIASTTAALDPALSWGPTAPSVQNAAGECQVSIPATMTLDSAATLQGTLGSVQGATVTSSTDGLTANLTDFTLGLRAVSWTVNDSLLGTANIAKNVTLAMGTGEWLPAAPKSTLPEAKLGRDAAEGRQPLFATALACPLSSTGRRAALAAGTNDTCAVTTTGALKCWGYNLWGELGLGNSTEQVAPVAVPALGTSTVAVAAGQGYICALSSGGAIKCSGGNYNGQLGVGDTINRLTPTAALGTSYVSVEAGGWHACALTAGGVVRCWGANAQGQLGLGDTVDRTSPTDVATLGTSNVAVVTGGMHNCALSASGVVKCWGYNGVGQLGLGDTANRTSPAAVAALGTSTVDLAAGGNHTCALTATGAVTCWGYNTNGQLGLGDTTNRTAPVAVTALGTSTLAMAAGGSHTCSLTAAGSVKCWGWNVHGGLGLGDSLDRLGPVDVPALGTSIAAVVAGDYNACAITSAGGVKCWGWNIFGQLGLGDSTDRFTPVATSVLDGAVLMQSSLVVTP